MKDFQNELVFYSTVFFLPEFIFWGGDKVGLVKCYAVLRKKSCTIVSYDS